MLSARGLRQRSDFLQAVRGFFLARNYVEVDTPARLPVLLPEAEILPVTSDGWFLQTSPESCMKRLLARGLEAIFQICHCWRAGEQGRLHEVEFSLLEWYQTGKEYRDGMAECEALLPFVASCLNGLPGLAGEETLCRGERRVLLAPPWPRITVEEAFCRHAGMDAEEALERGCFDEVLVTRVEPHLGWDSPVFLYDYPARLASLARKKQVAPHLAERFELYLCGIELANGFSELVDPQEQRQRFTEELALLRERGHAVEMPEAFLDELSCMPESVGVALGLDRLFMLLMGAEQLVDVLPFPARVL